MAFYRVKDTTFDQPFFLRLFSLANILIDSSDVSLRQSAIRAIPAADVKRLRETLRPYVERLRDRQVIPQRRGYSCFAGTRLSSPGKKT